MKKNIILICVAVGLIITAFIGGFFIGKHVEHKYMLSESGEGEYIDAKVERDRKKMIGKWRKPNTALSIEEYNTAFKNAHIVGNNMAQYPNVGMPYTLEIDEDFNFTIEEYTCHDLTSNGCEKYSTRISKGEYSSAGIHSAGYYIIKQIKEASDQEFKEARQQVSFYLYDDNTLQLTISHGVNRYTVDLIK